MTGNGPRDPYAQAQPEQPRPQGVLPLRPAHQEADHGDEGAPNQPGGAGQGYPRIPQTGQAGEQPPAAPTAGSPYGQQTQTPYWQQDPYGGARAQQPQAPAAYEPPTQPVPRAYEPPTQPVPRAQSPRAQSPHAQSPYGSQDPREARYAPPANPPAADGPYPGGPLSLPDETSIYTYGGQAPDGYTGVQPGYRDAGPDAGRYDDRGYGRPRYDDSPQAPARPQRRLDWRELLGGLVSRPGRTMSYVRDQSYWWPALIMSALGGVLAVFANDAARHEIMKSTLNASVPTLGFVAVVVPAFFAVLGVVSHALARQNGGNGSVAPFTTLSMVVVWLMDAPRLAVSLFAPDTNALVVVLSLATFALTAWLLTMLMQRVHELPWPKALGCVSIQLLAVLLILKLPLG